MTVDVALVHGLQNGLAYLDGGTGSLVLQALLGGVLTVGYVVKTQWCHIKARLAQVTRTRSR